MEFPSLQSLALKVGEARTAERFSGASSRAWQNKEMLHWRVSGLFSRVIFRDSCLMRKDCPDQARYLPLVASAGNPRAPEQD